MVLGFNMLGSLVHNPRPGGTLSLEIANFWTQKFNEVKICNVLYFSQSQSLISVHINLCLRKSPKQKDFKWVTDTAEGREAELKEQLLTRNGIVGRYIVKTPK